MVAPQIDQGRTDHLLQFILAVASEQDDFRDRSLGPIHLLKYTYLADVAYAESHNGDSFTGVTWQFHHFGPWSAEAFERIEPAADAVGAARHVLSSPKSADDFIRYELRPARGQIEQLEAPLPLTMIGVVRSSVREFGTDTASLLRHVYLTEPMLRAAPGEHLLLGRETSSTEPPAPAPLPGPAPSKSAVRRRREQMKSLRERVRERLAGERRPEISAVPPPRYDDVYADGIAWLDRLAGEPIRPIEGELTIAEDVWKSATRGTPDVP